MISSRTDEPYFADWMRVKDVLSIFADLYHDFDYLRCLEIMQRFQIDENMRIKTMSKGTKEKFQLALVMSRHATLIVLDEPIGGVDPAAREVILDTILNNYREDQTILIATHLIADIERIFDSVLFIKDGVIVLDDNVEEIRLKTKKSIDELFREEFISLVLLFNLFHLLAKRVFPKLSKCFSKTASPGAEKPPQDP